MSRDGRWLSSLNCIPDKAVWPTLESVDRPAAGRSVHADWELSSFAAAVGLFPPRRRVASALLDLWANLRIVLRNYRRRE